MLKIDRESLYTIDDFMKNKGCDKLVKGYRTVGKTINFSMLFGATASSFAKTLEESGFTEADCDNYISLTKSQDKYDELLRAKTSKISPDTDMKSFKKSIKFLLVAELMRNSFFNSYKGLMGRIKREQEFCINKGYVRTHHGPVRHLPILKLMDVKFSDYFGDYKLGGNDAKRFSKKFSEAMNESCNSTIQSMEARIVFNTWVNINKYLRKWKLKSRIWNSIHDSLDFYVYKPELELVLALANACASFPREPVKSIPMSMDFEVADVRDMEHRNKTYWKHGAEMEAVPIEVAIEHYNAKYKTNFKWEGCTDYGVELGKQDWKETA